ncbi:transposase [Planctomycetota bacterium]|nr:transposase [Planctomycetota bacterium]
MPHTYVVTYVHVVFSTKGRRPLISVEAMPRLHAYLGGITREHDTVAMEIGGVEDHVHLLLKIPATVAVAKLVQLIKGGSSKWMNGNITSDFSRQEGYGAFSVGQSQLDITRRYILNQAEHHRTGSFQDEYRAFLTKHGIAWDEAHVWG